MYPTVKQAPQMKPASPRQAVDGMLARLEPVGTERIALHEATGRVLAERISTDRPSPAADVSAMDGYAGRMADIAPGATLPVLGEARIGCERHRVDVVVDHRIEIAIHERLEATTVAFLLLRPGRRGA